MQKRYILGAIALLVLAAVACSLGGKTTTPAPQATQPPAGEEVQPTPTTESAEEAPPPEISSEALRNLNSYRSRLVWFQEVEGKPRETTTVEQEETRDPAARRMVITSEGGENPGKVEMVQIGDTSWLCSTDGCIQTQTSAENEFGDVLFKPEDFTPSEYKYVGRDTVNGVRSRHYVLTLDPATVAALAQGDITSVQGDVWISDEAGMPQYVTRFTVSWEGTQDGKKLTGGWTYEVYDVNKPITIEPPEGATGVPDDVPIYEGAADLSIMGGMILYSCADTVANVAEFYRNEMPGQGWTAGEESAMGDMITQEWTKGDRKASITILPKDGGGTNVMITLEQP